jgi:hypothetical protein
MNYPTHIPGSDGPGPCQNDGQCSDCMDEMPPACEECAEHDMDRCDADCKAAALARVDVLLERHRVEAAAVLAKSKLPYAGPWAWLADCKMDGTGWK